MSQPLWGLACGPGGLLSYAMDRPSRTRRIIAPHQKGAQWGAFGMLTPGVTDAHGHTGFYQEALLACPGALWKYFL